MEQEKQEEMVEKNPFENKKIIFCLPGDNFSGRFLDCWTQITMSCMLNGVRFVVSRAKDSNVYFVRSKCLGGDVKRGPNQKPYDGKIDYDYLMWIDSDIFFTEMHFYNLLARAIFNNLDIVSGLYKMEGGQDYAAVKDWDLEFFEKNGHFKFLNDQDLTEAREKKELIKVDYSGMGFMLIKRGVFESLQYPWFKPAVHKISELEDFSSEDVSFCLKAKEAGYSVYVDPSVIVGHIKETII